ncbi:MAG: SNF2-related protein, partial [Acutalibacteraceae bacterium]
RAEPVQLTPESTPSWVKVGKDTNGIEMNQYFVEHPEMLCGTMQMVSGQHGMRSACVANEGENLKDKLHDALSHLHGEIKPIEVEQPMQQVGNSAVQVAVPEEVRLDSFFLSDGKVYFYGVEGVLEPTFNFKKNASSKVIKEGLERITAMIEVRDCARELLAMQLDEYTGEELVKVQQDKLNTAYDNFVAKYGRLNDEQNTKLFKGDCSLPLLKSLEVVDSQGAFVRKADIFTKRTIKAHKTVLCADTSADALAITMSEKAKVDLDKMSNLTGFTKDKIIEDLKGVIYRMPYTDDYVMADEYLSGNIREKLALARQAQKEQGGYEQNVQALTDVMPKPLDASEIDVRLGATWIKPEYIQQFMFETFGTPSYLKPTGVDILDRGKKIVSVQFSAATGKWNIANKSADKGVNACTKYGTPEKSAYQILEDTLNLKTSKVLRHVMVDGKERDQVDPDKTAAVQQKQELIKEKFKEWIFAEKSRRDEIVNTYNILFNSVRPREYDGQFLNFVGMNPEITLRPHQLNAVAHALYGGNTLLAHEVGAGKTFEMIAIAMEGRRLGLHHKSLFAVPNHLTEQMGADFLKLYPNANVLVATTNDFKKENRKALFAKIATGDYDAVIIGHSQLSNIPISKERQERFIKEQIDELASGIIELKNQNGEKYQISQLEESKKRLEKKLNDLLDTPKDDVVTFEELGIDKLFIDEAHEFKNLFLSTKMQNVSGIATNNNVQKTADLYMKCKYLDELTGGKGIVFATGTPVSNTMCEIYNMMRYLQAGLLEKTGLKNFDAWATTFGENVTALELAPEGTGYRMKTRFAKFYNLPELMSMFKECADIQTADTLHLPTPECSIHNISVPPTETQTELVAALSERAAKVHRRLVEPNVDNMLKITTDGRKIGLDQRLINPDLPDEPGTKVNMCVNNVFRIWDETQEQKLTQLIFCDFSTPKGDGSFNLYDDIKQKLIAKGVPENEIAFIHDATNEVQKEQLFAKIRAGEVRVLIGSTAKMGAGTNVQDRLIASHDLDCPWKPSDMEQRRGRMVRQGNSNAHVHLYRYVTEKTFDAYLFQMLENKQKFISQIMTSKSPVRSCDDVDEAVLSYAEVKALCAGDPRIKEKMELDIEVAKLKQAEAHYKKEQYTLEDTVVKLKKQKEELEAVIPKMQNDLLTCQNEHPPVFD